MLGIGELTPEYAALHETGPAAIPPRPFVQLSDESVDRIMNEMARELRPDEMKPKDRKALSKEIESALQVAAASPLEDD